MDILCYSGSQRHRHSDDDVLIIWSTRGYFRLSRNLDSRSLLSVRPATLSSIEYSVERHSQSTVTLLMPDFFYVVSCPL
jgi:cupin superfamily acireductone dioxygenase involved in methionine salvage